MRIDDHDGSITVFLALILIMVFGLVGTMIEVTRSQVCTVHARRILKSASDSLLTEYSRPLFDEYHLFFLEDIGKPFETSIAEYSANTLHSKKGLFPQTDLYDGTLTNVEISDKKYVGDEAGDVLKNQIVSYMKREIAVDAINEIKKSLSSLEELYESANEIEKKVETEKDASENSEAFLELMKYIDGVSCSTTEVKGQSAFVKMLFCGDKRSETFGITEPSVWKVVKDRVVAVDKLLDEIQGDVASKRKFSNQLASVKDATENAIRIAKSNRNILTQMSCGLKAIDILSSNLSIINQTQELIKNNITDSTISTLKSMWKKYDTSGIVFDYSGLGEPGGAENPMDKFSDEVSGGLLNLVIRDDKKVSTKSVKKPDHYNQLYDENKTEDSKGAVENFVEDKELEFGDAVKGAGHVALDDYFLLQYIKKYFSSYVQKVGEKENKLLYECEYLAGGKQSDKENLEQMVEKLMMVRTLINATAVFSSTKNRETAYAAAVVVVGFTGLEPLIRFTQTLFLVLWGMAEATVDVAGIIQQKHVPLMKSSSDLNVDFTELLGFGKTLIKSKVDKLPKEKKSSFGYDKYLMLFLLQQGTSTVCYRMMDLMEWKIRKNYVPGFNIGMCVNSFCATGSFTYKTKFFRLSILSDLLNRKRNYFNKRVSVQGGYTPW